MKSQVHMKQRRWKLLLLLLRSHRHASVVLPRDALQCKARYWDCMSSVSPSVCPFKILEKKERGHIQGLPNFLDTPVISGTGEATDFECGRYIHRVHSSKCPWKILEKRAHGRIQGLAKFWGYNQLSQERVKVRNSNFVRTFIGSIGTKAH